MRTRSARNAEPARGAKRATGLQALPDELLVRVFVRLPSILDFGCVDCVCRAWHARGSPVEQALRERIEARGEAMPAPIAKMFDRKDHEHMAGKDHGSIVQGNGNGNGSDNGNEDEDDGDIGNNNGNGNGNDVEDDENDVAGAAKAAAQRTSPLRFVLKENCGVAPAGVQAVMEWVRRSKNRLY